MVFDLYNVFCFCLLLHVAVGPNSPPPVSATPAIAMFAF